MRKYRVVVDTNLLISAIIAARSIPDQLMQLWKEDRYILITSDQLLDEIKDVAERDHFKKYYPLFSKLSAELIDNLSLSADLVNHLPEENLPIHCRDAKDDKLLACAIGGQAEYLVTGDNDLLALNGNKKLKNLTIITARQFLDIYNNR